MNIAVFTDLFLPGKGGSELATYYLCKNLVNLGHNLILFCPDYHAEQSFDEFPVFRVKSIKLTEGDMLALVTLDKGRIYKKLKEFAPDIIYFCSASGLSKSALQMAKKFNVKTVATIHTKYKEAFYYSTHSKLITGVVVKTLAKRLNKTDRVFAVSNDMARQLKSYGCKKEVTVIKNGVIPAEEIFTPKSALDGRRINFMFCGHLIEAKNIHFTLRCLGYLKREKGFDNFTFSVVGADGGYGKKLKALVKKENLTENVVFKGFVKDRKVLNSLYAAADLFLFPSTFDTDGLVICEAAQAGTPTLTLKDYGAGERITDNETGFLANYDLRDYAERIYEIINNPELFDRVCKNAHNLHGESWLETAKKYEEVFGKLINNG